MKRDFLEDRKRIQSAGKINTRLRKENDDLKEKVNLFCCHFINTILIKVLNCCTAVKNKSFKFEKVLIHTDNVKIYYEFKISAWV